MGRIIWPVYGAGSFLRHPFFLILTGDSLLLVYMPGRRFTVQFFPGLGSPSPASRTKEGLRIPTVVK